MSDEVSNIPGMPGTKFTGPDGTEFCLHVVWSPTEGAAAVVHDPASDVVYAQRTVSASEYKTKKKHRWRWN